MIDKPAAIDPLVSEGPRQPMETLRPGVSLQRVLLLAGQRMLMADLASGDIRPYENGPPVSVPMASDRFDLRTLHRLQIQVNRDPRASSTSQVLLGIDIYSARRAIHVSITNDEELRIHAAGEADSRATTGPCGESPAFVIVLEPNDDGLTVSVRNAETMTGRSIDFTVADLSDVGLIVGGPSILGGGSAGRTRLTPVLVDVQRPVEAVDRVRRLVGVARRVAGDVRRRIG